MFKKGNNGCPADVRYKANNIQIKNKLRKILRHLKKHPNDEKSRNAL